MNRGWATIYCSNVKKSSQVFTKRKYRTHYPVNWICIKFLGYLIESLSDLSWCLQSMYAEKASSAHSISDKQIWLVVLTLHIKFQVKSRKRWPQMPSLVPNSMNPVGEWLNWLAHLMRWRVWFLHSQPVFLWCSPLWVLSDPCSHCLCHKVFWEWYILLHSPLFGI